MNKEQLLAARQLEKALNHCGEVGLTGGVYDSIFCLWPTDKPSPHEAPEFFDEGVEGISDGSRLCHKKIRLDGGAGN
jgi:hypothetical protein